MQKLICIRHPKYEGRSPPVLSCKTCCSLFVDAVKEENESRSFNAYEFLDQKAKEAKGRRHGQGSLDFNPEII